MNLQSLIENAKVKARESNCRVPMVAYLVKSGKIVSYGVNKKGFRGASIHAEIDCLRKVRFQKKRGKNATLIMIRHKKDGSLGTAKPCANCIEILKGMGIKTVIWSTTDGVFESAKLADMESDYLTRPCALYGVSVDYGLDNFAPIGGD